MKHNKCLLWEPKYEYFFETLSDFLPDVRDIMYLQLFNFYCNTLDNIKDDLCRIGL